MKKIKDIHPKLIFEWDESSKESRSLKKKSVFVSSKKENITTYYKTDRPAGHITYLWCYNMFGDVCPPLIISSQKTCDEDLMKYGLYDGPNSYCISTSNGYITTDALLHYIENIVIPFFKKIIQDNQITNSKIFLLQDQMSAHIEKDVLNKLEEANVIVHNYHPHTTQIVCSLDGTIFPAWKAAGRRVKFNNIDLSKRSFEIYKMVYAFESVVGPLKCLNSWKLVGWEYDYKNPTKVNFNVETILKRHRAPIEESKEVEKIEKKDNVKRKKLLRFKSKKEKKRKKQKEKNK